MNVFKIHNVDSAPNNSKLVLEKPMNKWREVWGVRALK